MKRLSKLEINRLKHLAKKGFSLNKISQFTNTPKSTVYYHTKKLVRKMGKFKIHRLSEWERGYITGFFVGDGNFDIIKNNYCYRVVFNLNKKTEQKTINKILHILKKAGSNPYVSTYKNLAKVICISKELYQYLNNHVLYTYKEKGKKIIRKRYSFYDFKGWGRKFKFGFLAGMIDSDGYIGPDRTSIRCLITTWSMDLALNLKYLIESLNLTVYLQNDKYHNTYVIRISTPSFIKNRKNINCIKKCKGR